MPLSSSRVSDRPENPCPDEPGGLPQPVMEQLEDRLLLAGEAPVFATDLSSVYYLLSGRSLAIGVDGKDADSPELTITATSSNPKITIRKVNTTTCAGLYFTTSSGALIGHVVVQLFTEEAALATSRFITLATKHVNSNGTITSGTPFYTDVKVHRVISNFMIQTGDAALGTGSGSSPLGTFADQFDPVLSHGGRGVLSMANRGADTNDCQFFITAAPTHWLDQRHVIFGQVIYGWKALETIYDLPRDTNDRPTNPPLLKAVTIFQSRQDATFIFQATGSGFIESTITFTITDERGNRVTRTVQVRTYNGAPAPAGAEAMAVTVVGSRMYVATGIGGLEVYDVRNPAAPVRLGGYDTPGEARDVKVSGSTAFVADSFGGILSLGVANPAAIKLLDQELVGSAAIDLDLAGSVLYVACYDKGLKAFSVADPRNIRLLGSIIQPLPKKNSVQNVSVAVSGNRAFVSDLQGGFVVVDVSDPARMKSLKAEVSGGSPWGLDVAGDRLYLAVQNYGLAVYNVAKPQQPVMMGVKQVDFVPWQVRVMNQVAVLGNYKGGLAIMDVYNPADMFVHLEFPMLGSGGLAAAVGSHLVAPLGDKGLVFMDAWRYINRTVFLGKRTFIDDSGRAVTVALKNAIAAAYTTRQGNGAIRELEILNNYSNATVKVSAKGGARIGTIRAYKAFASLDVRTVSIDGDLLLSGGVAKLTLGNVNAAAEQTITLGGSGVTTAKFGQLRNVTISSSMSFKSLSMAEWFDSGQADAMAAPYVAKLTCKGNFQADATVGRSGLAGVLASAKIAGGLSDCTWMVTGSIGKLTVSGMVSRAKVQAGVGMDSVKIGGADQADFLAGVVGGDGHRPTAGAHVKSGSYINKFAVKGPKASPPRWLFARSNIAAARIGKVDLLNVRADAGPEFGVWGRAVSGGIGTIKCLDRATGAKLYWPANQVTFPNPKLFFRIRNL